MNTTYKILKLEERVVVLEKILNKLIVWIALSANNPLSVNECEQLLRELNE